MNSCIFMKDPFSLTSALTVKMPFSIQSLNRNVFPPILNLLLSNKGSAKNSSGEVGSVTLCNLLNALKKSDQKGFVVLFKKASGPHNLMLSSSGC